MKAGFALPHHLFQFRKGCVNRTGTELAGAIENTVGPSVDEDDGALAHALVAAVGLAGREAQAAQNCRPPSSRNTGSAMPASRTPTGLFR